MGNRATITLKDDNQDRGLYLHWNGGEGCIAAFLKETKKRMSFGSGRTNTEFKIKDENDITAFYATFYGVVREYVGYCTVYKDRAPTSVYMASNQNIEQGCGDNGCYLIESDFTCSRLNLDNHDSSETERFNGIGEFFEEVHHALCAVVDEEEDSITSKEVSTEELEAQLVYAEEIARNAALRKQRLIEKIAARKTLEAAIA